MLRPLKKTCMPYHKWAKSLNDLPVVICYTQKEYVVYN